MCVRVCRPRGREGERERERERERKTHSSRSLSRSGVGGLLLRTRTFALCLHSSMHTAMRMIGMTTHSRICGSRRRSLTILKVGGLNRQLSSAAACSFRIDVFFIGGVWAQDDLAGAILGKCGDCVQEK